MEAGPANEVEPTSPGVPLEREFDRAWARTVFNHAVRRLELEFAEDGKQAQFLILAPLLSRPAGSGDYDRMAVEIGVRAALMATVVSRFRLRFRELVRAEIGATVESAADIDSELSYLVELMAG